MAECVWAAGGLMRTAPELEAVYRLPRETESLAEAMRLRHRDIDGLDDAQLARERRLIVERLEVDRDPSAVAWQRQRLLTIEAELDRRVADDR